MIFLSHILILKHLPQFYELYEQRLSVDVSQAPFAPPNANLEDDDEEILNLFTEFMDERFDADISNMSPV